MSKREGLNKYLHEARKDYKTIFNVLTNKLILASKPSKLFGACTRRISLKFGVLSTF